ncbi:MAG: DinB family protein [Chitinophagaceae bacterium]
MTQNDLILRSLKEIRRRSTILWEGLPEEFYNWQPDNNAMTAIQVIRHVLEADYGWNIIINRGDMSNYQTPWKGRPYMSVKEELAFAAPYRQQFLESINRFSETELAETIIIHPGNGAEKLLGDYILRIGYHESVHTGQFLSYLRTIGIERPFIWD